MRLSGFVAASLLFMVLSVSVLCQHSPGGGGFSGGVSAGGGGSSMSSGGAVSHGGGMSSAGNSGGSHSSSYVPSSGRTEGAKVGSNAARSNESARASNPKSEKRGFFGFLHHQKAQQRTAAFVPPVRCMRGQNCSVCRKTGTCIVETSCANGLVWNGFSCSAQYAWWNDCAQIASQLAAMRRQMRGQNDPGLGLMYDLLLRQYQSCQARYGGAPLFADAGWLDLP